MGIRIWDWVWDSDYFNNLFGYAVMKPGDMVQMVTGLPGYRSNPRNNGIVIKVMKAPSTKRITRRVATVFTAAGEMVTWPLNSNYEIKVINESR